MEDPVGGDALAAHVFDRPIHAKVVLERPSNVAAAQPVTLRSLLRRKLAVRAALAVIAVVAICGAALLASGSGGQVGRFGLWLAVALAYSLFWFGLAAVVNSIGMRSHGNAAILVCCWLAVVLIVPTALNLGLQAAMPAPSRLERIGEVREVGIAGTRFEVPVLASLNIPALLLAAVAAIAVFRFKAGGFGIQYDLAHGSVSISLVVYQISRN